MVTFSTALFVMGSPEDLGIARDLVEEARQLMPRHTCTEESKGYFVFSGDVSDFLAPVIRTLGQETSAEWLLYRLTTSAGGGTPYSLRVLADSKLGWSSLEEAPSQPRP